MKARIWLLTLSMASYLGSFSELKAADANAAVWEPDWSRAQAGTRPSDLEVEAEAPPEEYAKATTTCVSFLEMPGNATQVVLALKDASGSGESLSASVSKAGFSANAARLSFQFYTPSAHRNGALLVRLLNREGECLASFSLFSKQHERGELLLNTFAAQSERQMPGEAGLYADRTWTPVVLDYNGPERRWSLKIGERTFEGLSVDALALDPAVDRFEIHTGFGKASMTQLYIDRLSFETL